MKSLSLALDWTPNTNHTGFFAAQSMGYYKDAGIELDLRSPRNDDYSTTPAKKLELGEVDLAIAPTESLISYRTKSDPFFMRAIAALLQEDASAITVLKNSGIERPEDLDNKTYASYGARYEDEIVKQLIKNDGGEGNLDLHYPDKLGIWNTLVHGTHDATWIFTAWEGVEAERRGIELTSFKLGGYGIPYGYSPVVCAAEDFIEAETDTLTSFLKATEKGFRFAINNPEEASDFLLDEITDHDILYIDLLKSQQIINQYYTKNDTWGRMQHSVFAKFIEWLNQHNLVPEHLDAEKLYTNQCFELRSEGV